MAELGLKYKNEKKIFVEKEEYGVPYLAYPLFEDTGILNHGFSTRLGGVSVGDCATMNISTTRDDDPAAVEENRRRIARALGVKVENMTYTNQTHTTHVVNVKDGDQGKTFMETDGMITDVPGICLVTFYADCVPLYFVDPVKKVIALSHSGWKGTVGKIGLVTVKKMVSDYGCNPGDILAAVGPSICKDCYEVSEDVADRFREVFGEKAENFIRASVFHPEEKGKYMLDLWAACRENFLQAGVREENIEVSDYCTRCHPELFYSHRVMGAQRGSLAAFMALE